VGWRDNYDRLVVLASPEEHTADAEVTNIGPVVVAPLG
jgi:hypothetical protein